MCGICGVLRFDGKPLEGRVTLACRTMLHRGPDHHDSWTFAQDKTAVELGAARLAVLDPGVKANQPFHRDGRYHLVYNGEVYNFRELRSELTRSGDSFETEGDTEVVAAACARLGTGALNRLSGMWALCFFDSQKRSGFIARDPLGIKPLVYAATDDSLCFASELRAMLPLGSWNREIDADALVEHLTFGYIAHPATIYRGARRLPPGQYLAFGPESIGQPQSYHEMPVALPSDLSGLGYGALCSAVRRRIGDAVARQRVSDVPVGAFLSGGVDSSVVAFHLAAATPQPIHTFCVGYSKQESYDERAYARIMAEFLSTRHEEIVLGEADVLGAVPRVLDHLGEPVGDSSILPAALVSQVARRYVTVALSGDGGDELFGGYWRYLAHASRESYMRLPAPIRIATERLLLGASVSRSSSLGNRLRQFRKLIRADSPNPIARHAAWSRILEPRAEPLFMRPGLVDACVEEWMSTGRMAAAPFLAHDPLNGILRFDLLHQLPADMLHKVDLAGMMHSLEVRVPLLDLAVVEAMASLPSTLKIDRGIRKRILVDAYRSHLPDAILDRPKKGFEVPVGEFLRGPLRGLFQDVVDRKTIESFEILSYNAVETIYHEHAHRRADHVDLLWALLSLCWWKRRFGPPKLAVS